MRRKPQNTQHKALVSCNSGLRVFSIVLGDFQLYQAGLNSVCCKGLGERFTLLGKG